MALIKVHSAGLRKNVLDLNRQISDLEALIAKTEVLLTRMQTTWEGEASAAYVNGVRNKLKAAKDMVGVLETYASYMTTAAERFDETDSSCAARINGIF